jgi:acetyl esterase/lipase
VLDPISVETAEFNSALEALLHQYPLLTNLSPNEARRLRQEGKSAFGPVVRSESAVEREVPGGQGSVRARVFVAERPRAVYLHIHGGGWVLGAIDQQDPRLEALSQACGVTVVSIDYRLAPEHPFPAGLEDCEAAAAWLVDNAGAEFGSERLLIGGESAGANLAVATLLRLRDRHGFTGWAGANLVYGAFDARLTPSARHWGERLLVLNTPIIEWFLDHYVGEGPRDDPYVSPLFGDLRNMPPALFTAGTEDPLIDDTLFMHQRWQAAGNEAALAIYPGGAHGFDAFPIDIGRRALAGMYGFIEDCLVSRSGLTS